MKNLISQIETAFSNHFTINVVETAVPLLSMQWGVKDEDALVHSLGANLLAAIGRACGYIGLVEFPAPRSQKWPKKLVRVDTAWIDPIEKRPILLAEFQKWVNETEAKEKAANLFVASHGFDKAVDALLLCLWSLDGQIPKSTAFDPYQPLAVSGGPNVGRPDQSKLFVLHALFGRKGDYFHLRSFRRIR